MRIIGEIPHPECKITLLSWNNRYLIKLEQGLYEQTYKIDASELASESEVMAMVDKTFIDECLSRFPEMHNSLFSALARV